MTSRDKNLRLAPTDGVRDQLQVLVDMGFFNSLSAAASHILNLYTGIALRSMQESRDVPRHRQIYRSHLISAERDDDNRIS